MINYWRISFDIFFNFIKMCCLICFNYVSFEKDVTNHFTPVLGSVFARPKLLAQCIFTHLLENCQT